MELFNKQLRTREHNIAGIMGAPRGFHDDDDDDDDDDDGAAAAAAAGGAGGGAGGGGGGFCSRFCRFQSCETP